jgi:hypothetical protein
MKGEQAMTEFPAGTRIAIPLPWEHCPSGCVEFMFVGWTSEDDAGRRLPILDDGYEEPVAWGSKDPRTGEWHFLDGERCNDADLLPTFQRRRN